MAFFKGDIISQSLGMNTQVNVIIPEIFDENGKKKPGKLLYALHGLSDNATGWTRLTHIERLANQYNFTVIMPEVQRSFYTDMKYGPQYFTYIAEELPRLMKELFNIAADRENTFVMGLSMGGYGALKCALSRPENYKACAAYSSCADIQARVEQADILGMTQEFKAVLGPDMSIEPKEDLFALASKLKETPGQRVPGLLLTCGTDDFLYQDNQRLLHHLERIGLPHEYYEWKGDHTWEFWEQSMKLAFDYFENGKISPSDYDFLRK